jgi:hypothetical protein
VFRVPIGDNPFLEPGHDLGVLLQDQGISITVETQGTSSGDIYDTPTKGTTKSATVLFIGLEAVEDPTMAGGKTKEIFYFIGTTGTAQMNDIVHYNGYKYDVSHVLPGYMGSISQMEQYQAEREIN